ncbi:hypothetical protein EDD21DRAFT_179599 [Dissophora ornata]|nr:hypothetical protein EDD21DRAFT_179599 [Dissophora ornata]
MAGPLKPSPQASSGSSSPPDTSASTSQSGSWSGTRPVADNTPAAPLEPQQGIQPRISSAMPTTILRATSAIEHQSIAAPMTDGSLMTSASSSAALTASSGDPTGFKIRIPRDLPNLPDVFRKLGATRSLPSSSPSSQHTPASSLTSRARSVGSEPLYQTKLVLSHQGAVGHTKRGNSGMGSDETQAPRSYHMLGTQVASEKRLKSTKSETGPPPLRRIDSPDSDPPTTPIVMRESKAPWTLLNFVRSSEAQSSTPKARSNPTLEIASSPELRSPSPSGTSPISNIASKSALNSTLNSAYYPTSGPTSDNTAAGSTKRKGIADVPTNNPLKTKRPRSRSKSESDSPTPALVRFPTPTSLSGGPVADVEDAAALLQAKITPPASSSAPPTFGQQINTRSVPASAAPSHTHETRLTDIERAVALAGESIASSATSALPSAMSMTPDPSEPLLTPLEMVRVGTTILDRLLSNPISRNFVNKVPLAITNYHAVIKRPMDLVTIEQRLWKSLDIYQSTSSELSTSAPAAATSHMNVSEGYSGLQHFERDLRRIYLNAIYFNSPQDPLHKEAQQFEVLYTGLLLAYREQ